MRVEAHKTNKDYHYETMANEKKRKKLPNGTNRVLVEGLERGEIIKYVEKDIGFIVEVKKIQEISGDKHEEEALMRSLLNQFEQYLKISRKITQETYITFSDN